MPPFSDLRSMYMSMDRGWPEIVATLRDVLRPETLSVLPYKDRGTSVSLLKKLVPDLAKAALVEPERTMNLSATDAALEALQKVYVGGQKLPRRRWRATIERYAEDTASRGFAEFEAAQIDDLSKRYAADLAQIAQMDGVSHG